jgi:hypothetical protein
MYIIVIFSLYILYTFFYLIEEVLKMSRMKVAARVALMLSVVLMLGFTGCGGSKTGGGGGGGSKSSSAKGGGGGKKMSEEEQAQLDEARKAAEAAERKLSDLRLERIELEKGGQ